MKNAFLLSCILLNSLLNAQLNKLLFSYQDFGYHKQPVNVEIKKYQLQNGKVELSQSVVQEFDEKGNILKETTISHLENDSKTAKRWVYKNEMPWFEHRKNPQDKSHDYSVQYFWDAKKRLDKTETYAPEYEANADYLYNNKGVLFSVKGDIDGDKFEERYSYSINGELYKITTIFYITNSEWNTVSSLFHKGKEVANYANHYTNIELISDSENAVIKYKVLNEEKFAPKIEEMESQLYIDKITGGDLSSQIYQAGNKGQDLERTFLQVFETNQFDDFLSVADFNPTSRQIEELTFYKITYADGNVIGNTDFNKETQTYYENLMKQETELLKNKH